MRRGLVRRNPPRLLRESAVTQSRSLKVEKTHYTEGQENQAPELHVVLDKALLDLHRPPQDATSYTCKQLLPPSADGRACNRPKMPAQPHAVITHRTSKNTLPWSGHQLAATIPPDKHCADKHNGRLCSALHASKAVDLQQAVHHHNAKHSHKRPAAKSREGPEQSCGLKRCTHVRHKHARKVAPSATEPTPLHAYSGSCQTGHGLTSCKPHYRGEHAHQAASLWYARQLQ